MSREISLFSDYHQKENSVTNYCGLMMKLIYEDSPKRFEELLATLIQTDADTPVGPIFSQQTKKKDSIPDLTITQRSFSIFFETKLTNWFYTEQIEKHIEGFNDKTDTKILFLLSNFDTDRPENSFGNAIAQAKEANIILQPISYEDFIETLESVANTDYLSGLLEEFKVYLDRNGLLPKWKYLLDVVSCSGTVNEIENSSYICPDKGGAYSHRRAKYFGAYAQKRVFKIFEIKAVVSVGRGFDGSSIKWKNVEVGDKEIIKEAMQKIKRWDNRVRENESIPLQVFLLSEGVETNFVKSTDGGMLQSKLYFWDIAKDVNSLEELGQKLDNRNWKDLR
jgi:hypothetical protein